MDLHQAAAILLFLLYAASRLWFLPAEPQVIPSGMDQCFRKIFMVSYAEQSPFIGQLYLPFQPFISSLFYLLSHDALLTLPVMTLLFSLAIPVVAYALVKEAYDRNTALLVLAGLTLHATLFSHSVTSLSEALAVSLLLMSVYLFHKKHPLSSAVLYACLLLTRDEQKFIAPFFIILHLVFNQNRKTALLCAGIIALAAMAPLLTAWATSGNPVLRWEFERQRCANNPGTQLPFDALLLPFALSIPLFFHDGLRKTRTLLLLGGMGVGMFVGFQLAGALGIGILYPRYLVMISPLLLIASAPLLSRLGRYSVLLLILYAAYQGLLFFSFLTTLSYPDYSSGWWAANNSGKNIAYDLTTLPTQACTALFVHPVHENALLSYDYQMLPRIHECWNVLTNLGEVDPDKHAFIAYPARAPPHRIPLLGQLAYQGKDAYLYQTR